LDSVVILAEDPSLDSALRSGGGELIRARGIAARARIDEQESGYPAPF